MTGPKNHLADKLAAEAAAVLEATTAPDFPDGEEPGVPAEDPVVGDAEQVEDTEQTRLSVSDIFNIHYSTLVPNVVGPISNATERGRMREKIVDTALRLTEITLFGPRVVGGKGGD